MRPRPSCTTDRASTGTTPRSAWTSRLCCTSPRRWSTASPTPDCRSLLHETFKAFNGSGPELARLIESSRLLVDEANANFRQTSQLIDQVGPFLEAQIRCGDDIKSLSDGLARFTSEVRQADPQLRTLLTVVPPRRDQANTAFSGIRPSFPMLAANLANLGRIGVIYHKSIEQTLVILPALFAAIITVGQRRTRRTRAPSSTSRSTCRPAAVHHRLHSAAADSVAGRRDAAGTADRHVLQDRPERPVGGTRRAQLPVPGIPRQAGPDRSLCRDPKGYVPIGTNPWRGPPIPYGTPIDERAEHPAAQQVSRSFRRATTRIRGHR